MIRCNMCERLFNSEEELSIREEEIDGTGLTENYPVCPDCNTDAYLMDIAVDEED